MAKATGTVDGTEAVANPYDLMIVTDATASMGSYLESLTRSLPEIIRISALTGCFARIGVVAYRDYCGGQLTEWSGWYGVGADGGGAGGPGGEDGCTTSRTELLEFVGNLTPDFGGDWPEAAKTGVALAYQHMRADAKTIMLLYSDAPPHTPATGGNNMAREAASLKQKGSYGGTGHLFADWVSAAHTFRAGPKMCKVFSVIDSHLIDTLAPFVFLSARTRGTCIQIPQGANSSDLISELTFGLLLGWMGVENEQHQQQAKAGKGTQAIVVRYKDKKALADVQSETDEASKLFIVWRDKPEFVGQVSNNLTKETVAVDQLKEHVHPRPPMANFSRRYLADPSYRILVADQLEDIIMHDVTAMAVNPVFGSLWRTVCNDRGSEARDRLVQAFGAQVDRIADPDRKAKMKAWLEGSYDYAGEILELIRSVPEEDRFPCVYLDPTLDHSGFSGSGIGADDGAEAADADGKRGFSFTREELLEIGRSCDYRILRRLGRVLTNLSYVRSKEDLPAHIASEPEDKVPRIPIALTDSKYKSKFWKVLLHSVLPGTMLSPRPAALLAALSLRMGMAPLREVAEAEMAGWRGKWNTLDFPETWNTSCLNLLLEADAEVSKRAVSATVQADGEGAGKTVGLLKDEDRQLFRALVDYKMLEFNLSTTLTARVGWRPEKTKSATGPVAVCRKCAYPRSVTIMGEKGLCGMCLSKCDTKEEQDLFVNEGVSKDFDESTPLSWVECSVTTCRVQYVVYHPQKLNVRPKCHYCRLDTRVGGNSKIATTLAPFVECKRCLNRMVWPRAYRPMDFDEAGWNCPACTGGQHETIIEAETTAKAMSAENGTAFLLRNEGGKIPSPFNGRSLFHLVSNLGGTADFASRVGVLPSLQTANKTRPTLTLTVNGKPVHNVPALLSSLNSWVTSRRAEQGLCTLCFTGTRKDLLRPACGRRACAQRVCSSCHEGWYGQNAAGRVLNLAALSCPFCRRLPSPKALPPSVAALGGLSTALAEAGSWVHAWCVEGGHAARYVERICAAGAPAEVEDFVCDACREARLLAEAEAAEAALAAADAADAAALALEAARARSRVMLVSRACPGCRVETQKAGGCNHMTCPTPGCGMHWCWLCGRDVTGDPYGHIGREHGGLYAVGRERVGDMQGDFRVYEGDEGGDDGYLSED